MPELPEVENVCRYLVEVGLPGRAFLQANVSWGKSVKRPSVEDFVLEIPGGIVRGVSRRGKYIMLPLTGGKTLILHLGMTGGLRVHDRSRPEPPMVRHSFGLDDGRELRFIDPRKFGKMWLVEDPGEALPPFGPEPLGGSFTPDALVEILSGRNVPIKGLLLEQSVVAGLGNLYADEALYLSGINPQRRASELGPDEVGRLTEGIVAALTSALSQYDRSRAEDWPDPPFGLSTWSIPRQPGAACVRCEHSMSVIRVRGRTTYFCAACQPI